MEFSGYPFESSSNRTEKVEAGHLLEEGWFFGNLLDTTKTRIMIRCYSDPCPSSNYSQEMLVRGSKGKIPSSKKELPFVPPNLMRAPSLPTSIAREELTQEKESYSGVQKSLSRNLIQAPSLPPCIRGEEDEDQESEFTMGRLIRQASLNSSDMLHPRQTSKVMTQSCSVPRRRPQKKADQESSEMDGCKERKIKCTLIDQAKIEKSQSELGYEEVQEKQESNPGVVNILPGLQEKSRVELMAEGNKVRRKPYLSEAWHVKKSSPPTIPGWVDKKSADDMKAQIKFWARAVASNMRQEC